MMTDYEKLRKRSSQAPVETFRMTTSEAAKEGVWNRTREQYW